MKVMQSNPQQAQQYKTKMMEAGQSAQLTAEEAEKTYSTEVLLEMTQDQMDIQIEGYKRMMAAGPAPNQQEQ